MAGLRRNAHQQTREDVVPQRQPTMSATDCRQAVRHSNLDVHLAAKYLRVASIRVGQRFRFGGRLIGVVVVHFPLRFHGTLDLLHYEERLYILSHIILTQH